MSEKQEYLLWFYINADFGPGDGDERERLKRLYTEETGKPCPFEEEE